LEVHQRLLRFEIAQINAQVSISSTFYPSLFRTKVFSAAFLWLHVSRKKQRKALSYEKGAHKMLMKLTPGDNLFNIIKPETFMIKTTHCNHGTRQL